MANVAKVLVSLAMLTVACNSDNMQQPSFDLEPPPDCETQIIKDPSCPQDPPPTHIRYQVYFEQLSAESDDTLSSSSYAFDEESAPCPRWIAGFTTGITRDPHTGYFYSFASSGTWTIDWVASAVYLSSGQAIYNWPQGGGDGSWPAVNQTLGQSGAKIWIRQARGVCLAVNSVSFIQFYGVRVEDPNLRREDESPGGGGGGGGGGGDDCTSEWIIVEVDYGDGTGWHTLWQGYATVCG